AEEYQIPKTIYISTLAVFGDTRGETWTEENFTSEPPNSSNYINSKWETHKRAKEFISQGLNLTICMPGVAFGQGDKSVVGEGLLYFLKGYLPVVPGSDTGFTYVHVDDLTDALILAAEKGKPGEYITSGPNYRLEELVPVWAAASGRKPLKINIPSWMVKPSWVIMALLGLVLPLPQFLSGENTRYLGVTYFGSSEKAKRELGWTPKPVLQRLEETIAAMKKAGEFR
ncbi:MAG: NAD-dependent epimerase/dehydratase family protein, partial [Chloroflexota bacterium]